MSRQSGVKSAVFSIKDIQAVCFKMKVADLRIDVDSLAPCTSGYFWSFANVNK